MSLSNYTTAAQTKAFDELGAFFAFSLSQVKEQEVEGVDYTHLGGGLIAPKANADQLVERLDAIQEAGIKQDLADNGTKAIIHRELANYEAQITNDITDTAEALDQYGITKADIKNEYGSYFQMCIDNDYF